MKTIKQTGLAVPSKRLRSCVQHRQTTEQVWVMTLTKSIFDLYSVFLIIVIFFRFIVVFQNVSALYKCSVCFSRKSQNKQAEKPKPKVQPQSWKLHIRNRNGQTLLAQSSLLFPALCSAGRKQTKAVSLWHFVWPCQPWALHVTLATQPEPASAHTAPESCTSLAAHEPTLGAAGSAVHCTPRLPPPGKGPC